MVTQTNRQAQPIHLIRGPYRTDILKGNLRPKRPFRSTNSSIACYQSLSRAPHRPGLAYDFEQIVQ
jgi:hypothetical protein